MEALVKTQYGSMVGQAGDTFLIGDDETVTFDQPGLLIADCGLYNEQDKGKGFGKELYRQALNQYGRLYSIFPISDEAFNVHQSLVRSGEVIAEYPENDYGIFSLRRV